VKNRSLTAPIVSDLRETMVASHLHFVDGVRVLSAERFLPALG